MIKRLKERFEKNMNRHPDIAWDQVEARLRENPEVLEKLRKMEETGGQPVDDLLERAKAQGISVAESDGQIV